MVKENITDDGLVADLFHDGSNRPQPAIIMLGGSEGGSMWSSLVWKKLLLRHLVTRGYKIVTLAYFKTAGLPDSLEEIPLEYFEKAFDWLSGYKVLFQERYTLIGGSKGAELALLLASRYEQVSNVIALLPSSVVWQGIPKSRLDINKEGVSSWSYNGEALPFVPVTFSRRDIWKVLTLQLRTHHEQALLNTSRVEKASIPVEDIRGNILLISGKRDQLWPSSQMSDQIMDRLSAKFPNHFEHISYDKGHSAVLREKSCWRSVFRFLEDSHS